MYMGRNWDENFWDTLGYDSVVTSEGDTVRVSDYVSCAYMRTSWKSFEPEEGKYMERPQLATDAADTQRARPRT